MSKTREIEPLERLQRFVETFRTQTAAADELGISRQYLSQLLGSKRDFSDQVLAKIGLRRAVVEAGSKS